MAQNGLAIHVGDAVMLQPPPGEDELGIGVLEALWADRPPGSQEKWQARCRKFYRPSVRLSPAVLITLKLWQLTLNIEFLLHPTWT